MPNIVFALWAKWNFWKAAADERHWLGLWGESTLLQDESGDLTEITKQSCTTGQDFNGKKFRLIAVIFIYLIFPELTECFFWLDFPAWKVCYWILKDSGTVGEICAKLSNIYAPSLFIFWLLLLNIRAAIKSLIQCWCPSSCIRREQGRHLGGDERSCSGLLIRHFLSDNIPPKRPEVSLLFLQTKSWLNTSRSRIWVIFFFPTEVLGLSHYFVRGNTTKKTSWDK